MPDDIQPQSINPLGNYAVQVSWEDGFNQVASFELLESLRGEAVEGVAVLATVGGMTAVAELA